MDNTNKLRVKDAIAYCLRKAEEGKVFVGWNEEQLEAMVCQEIDQNQLVFCTDKITGEINGMLSYSVYPNDKEVYIKNVAADNSLVMANMYYHCLVLNNIPQDGGWVMKGKRHKNRHLQTIPISKKTEHLFSLFNYVRIS